MSFSLFPLLSILIVYAPTFLSSRLPFVAQTLGICTFLARHTMFSAHPRGRDRSRSDGGEYHTRRNPPNSQPQARFSAPDIWESSYVDTFDDDDTHHDDYSTQPSSSPVRRFHPGAFTNPWSGAPRPRSRSRSRSSRRASHLRISAQWEGNIPPPSPTPDNSCCSSPRTTRSRGDSQSRRHSAEEGRYRSNSRNDNPRHSSQRLWENEFLRVFDTEYAYDGNTNRRHSHLHSRSRRPSDNTPCMSGALSVPDESASTGTGSSGNTRSSRRSAKLPRHERQEQRARTAEWAVEDERERARRSSEKREPLPGHITVHPSDTPHIQIPVHLLNKDSRTTSDPEDAALAEAVQQTLRSFAEEQGKRRRRPALTPWYRRCGPGNSVDEALKERVARSVDEQNREIAMRNGGRDGRREGRRRSIRRVRFPDEGGL